MTPPYKFVLVFGLSAAVAALTLVHAQSGGSIDGVAIPSKVFTPYTRQNAISDLWRVGVDNPSEAEITARLNAYGVCGQLRSRLDYAAHERAAKEFNISVTPQEEAAERAKEIANTLSNNPQQQMQEMADLIPPALADVAQGKDPQQVYAADKLAEHGIAPQTWLMFQHMPNAKTAEGREKIRQQYLKGVQAYQNVATAHLDVKRVITSQKLDAAIDQKLAASDPQFRLDLTDCQSHGPCPTVGVIDDKSSLGRLNAKRAQFWAQQAAKLKVQLSDPSLKTKCNLSGMGVQ